jgi:hypothetical protein
MPRLPRPLAALAAVLALLSAAATAPAADVDLKSLLAGKVHPLTLKLKELGPDWHCLTTSEATGNLIQMYGMKLPALYTKGDTLTIAGETFLVGYALQKPGANFAALIRGASGSTPPEPERPGEDTPVSLTLVNLRTIQTLRDIRPFDLKQEIAGGGREADFITNTLQQSQRRSQASTILNEARMLDAAMDQWALENKKPPTDAPSFNDLVPYLKAGSRLATGGGKDALGNLYILGTPGKGPHVSPATKDALKDVTGGDNFWGPYS